MTALQFRKGSLAITRACPRESDTIYTPSDALASASSTQTAAWPARLVDGLPIEAIGEPATAVNVSRSKG